MRSLLERIKIIDYATIYLEIEKNEFLRLLKNNVDLGSTKSDFFEPFMGGKLDFRGQVSQNGFKIRRKKRLFDYNRSSAVVTGDVIQKNEQIQINLEISSFNNSIYFMIGGLAFMYLIFLSISLSVGGLPIVFIPLVLLHGLFILGIVLFTMRKSTSQLKKDIEKELYYISKK